MTRAIAVLVLVAGACGAAPHVATTTDDVAAVRETWTRAVNAKRLDPMLATYAIDAVILPITGARIVSAVAIKNLYERIWHRFTPHVELTSHIVERSGDLAYDSGEYVETVVAERAAVNIAGNYVFVYRRQAEGWRIVEQIWTEATGAPDGGPRTP